MQGVFQGRGNASTWLSSHELCAKRDVAKLKFQLSLLSGGCHFVQKAWRLKRCGFTERQRQVLSNRFVGQSRRLKATRSCGKDHGSIRGQEIEFVADIVLNLMKGLSDFSAAKLDRVYKDNDEEFPDSKSIRGRLDECFTNNPPVSDKSLIDFSGWAR